MFAQTTQHGYGWVEKQLAHVATDEETAQETAEETDAGRMRRAGHRHDGNILTMPNSRRPTGSDCELMSYNRPAARESTFT